MFSAVEYEHVNEASFVSVIVLSIGCAWRAGTTAYSANAPSTSEPKPHEHLACHGNRHRHVIANGQAVLASVAGQQHRAHRTRHLHVDTSGSVMMRPFRSSMAQITVAHLGPSLIAALPS
ncbi:MAG: hypothetical protein JWN62_2187 [Acidimicrobiales bacterium]|nr:hypothetical protein [Acidimicrobiales bacterium]